MADSNSGISPGAGQRRKSFVEMLNPKAFGGPSSSHTSGPSAAIPVPSSPGVAGGRKSMSMALGLSGSANGQESPFNAFARQRRASISTSTASGSPEFRNSFDNNAVIEEDDTVGAINAPPSPTFARRLSFGAQALRDAKSGTSASLGSNAGRRPSSSLFTLNEDSDQRHAKSFASAPGTAKTGGEGFNWSDAMRDRNKRTSMTSANPFLPAHNRSKSMNNPIPGPAPEPPKEMPRPSPAPAALRSKKPDHLGERMLRGDFMMD